MISMIRETYRSLLTAEKTIPSKLEEKSIHLPVRQMETPHRILKALTGIVSQSRHNCDWWLALKQPYTEHSKMFGGGSNRVSESLQNHYLLIKV